ncbi:Peptidase family C50 [Rhizoctonia solani]|uniref:separase n=1 Tax=Rhizoctonia solani TaxID=456999 RepID=A0A8H7INB5_9AGAM|nr:Peptidase family C50 [Rhizoctonia solani]
MPPATRSHKSAKSVAKVDEVTDGISNLKLRTKSTSSKVESTAKSVPQELPADRLRNSMVIVNEASQTLSSAVKSGWKLGSDGETEWSLERINKVMVPVPGALVTLRAVYKEQEKAEKLVDVERAALGVVSKLNGLRVVRKYTLALDLLANIRTGILSLLGAEEAEERPKSRAAKSKSSAPQTYLGLLRLPDLSSLPAPSQSLQVALATYQAHSIKAVLSGLNHSHLEELYTLLISPQFTLTRFPPPPGVLPTEQLSAIFVGTFQALAGSGALSPPPAGSSTTTAATATTKSARAPSVSRKTSGSSKSVPATKSGPSPEELVLLVRKQALLILARSPSLEKDTDLFWDQALKWGAIYVKGISGPRFEALCEWWIRFAKKVRRFLRCEGKEKKANLAGIQTKDVELIGKINGLVQGTDDRPKTPTKISRTVTEIAHADIKSATSAFGSMRIDTSCVARLFGSSIALRYSEDMHTAADALLTLCRSTSADSSLPQRVSDLRKACAKCWSKDKEATRKVVKAIVGCAVIPGFPAEITVSAIDALLTLSRNEIDASIRRRTDASDREDQRSTHPTLLRAISNTGYTLAGALYNASRATQAIAFIEQSCLVGERALALADVSGGSKDKEIVALREHMPRRWELLAICRLKATDRRGAVEGYSKALVWHVALLPPEVAKLDDKTSHFISQLVGISVSELFDPESVLLSRLFANLDVEEKLSCPVAQKAMELAAGELGKMWADRHPVKRAKLLISLLKHEYHTSGSSVKVSSGEILELLSSDNLKQDSRFKPYIPEYIAQTHIWNALLLHKSNAPTAEVVAQAIAGSEKLLAMITPVVEPVSAKTAGKRPVGGLGLFPGVEETDVDKMVEVHVRTSIDLSAQYIQLGQLETAMNVLSRSSELAETNGVRIGIPTLVMLRLLYADVLASAKLYISALELSEQIEPVEKGAAYMVKKQRLGCEHCNRALQPAGYMRPFKHQGAPAEPANPFEVQSTLAKAPTLDEASQAKKTVSRGAIMDGVQWQIAQGLLRTIFDLGEAYSLRGHSTRLWSWALAFEAGGTQMARGLLDEALETLAKAEEIVADPISTDTSYLNYLLGHHRQKEAASGEDAYAMYTQAQNVLQQLDENLNKLQRHKSVSKPTADILVPDIQGVIMREQIWLSRIGEVQPEEQKALEDLEKLPQTLKSKSEQASLLGRIALHEVYSQFRSDLFLSSLTESGNNRRTDGDDEQGRSIESTEPYRDALGTLGTAEQNFWKTLQLSVAQGDVTRIRESATNLARIMAFQSSLGKQGVEGAVLTAALLGINATTLRREMLDAIANKDKTKLGGDDIVWPAINEDGMPCDKPTKQPADCLQQTNLQKERISRATTSDRITSPSYSVCLWIGEGEKGTTKNNLATMMLWKELTSIIETSDRITHEGVNIEGNKQAIADWWSERTALDQRMRELLEIIEFCWLGIFKATVPNVHSADTLSLLRGRLDKAFKRNGIGGDKTSARPKLDKSLLDCFSSISPKCRDEELEDLAYFILDLYQLHGISIALSDVDIDTLVVDLRNALEEHALKTVPRPTQIEDHHMFLVLDKSAQRIPWESIPVLRGRSVSRIPSISFLVDRIQLARHRQGLPFASPDSKPGTQQLDRITIDPKRVRYVLNPKGDLKHTEKQFGPWLKRMTKEVGWSGTIGGYQLKKRWQDPSRKRFVHILRAWRGRAVHSITEDKTPFQVLYCYALGVFIRRDARNG